MSDQSPRLDLPFLQPAQAQKHVTHNEALRLLDVATQLVVKEFAAEAPPTAPVSGDLYALGASPQNSWAGHSGKLALWNGYAWEFVRPREGWRACLEGTAQMYVLTANQWTPITFPTNNLPQLGINTDADSQNRLAVSSDQTLLTHNGSNHRLTLNKASSSDTAGIVLQSDWSGRAAVELGPSDVLQIKTSPDGATWHDGLSLDTATGHVGIGGVGTPEADLTIHGSLSVSNDLKIGSPSFNLVYLDQNVVSMRSTGLTLFTGTSDGADTRVCTLSGGGNSNIYRGATLKLHGNEHTTFPGEARLESGVNRNVIVQTHGTGRIGLGVTTPQRKVHIGDALRLEPGTLPSNPAAGDLYFDATTHKLRCHDGTVWQDLF